jgi:N utilization substance protein B
VIDTSDSVLRRVRCLALEALYEADTAGHDAERAYERRLREVAEEDPEVARPGPAGYGRGMVRGVTRMRETIDRYIAAAATHRPLDAMPVIDRNILRLAIWELLADNAAPVGAVVNEAVELAHRYGGEASPGFVNAVLHTVSERIRRERERVEG